MSANKLVLISGTRSRFNKAINIVASLMSFTAAALCRVLQILNLLLIYHQVNKS